MAHINTDGPQPPGEGPTQALAVTSTTAVDTTASDSKVDWNSNWRESPLFAFLPSEEKKGPSTADSPKTKPPAAGFAFAKPHKLPASFSFSFSTPQPADQGPSSSSSESEASSDTAGSERQTKKQVSEPAPAAHETLPELMKKQTMDRRCQLLHRTHKHFGGLDEIKTAPIFTETARIRAERQASSAGGFDHPFSQYGLLAGDASDRKSDELFYNNVAAPSSTFICGSQGSGKSHTLSCLLENSLFQSAANELPRPLTGIVFHYDTFISDSQGSPCEAAYLSTNAAVRVRVLCAPTNM
jgi:hypothetical protein